MTPGHHPTGQWRGDALAHEAYVYGDDSEIAVRCVPFVQEGFARGEQVIVVAAEPARQVLRDALGADVARLAVFAPAEAWWQGGHATLRAYDRDLRVLRATGRPWRLIGEPVWLAREDGRVWSRFEAVANTCYAAYPYYSLCLHDRRRLKPEVIDHVLRTHPLVWDGAAPQPSPTYEDTATYLRSVEPVWWPRPASATSVRVGEPGQGRRAVREVAERDGWGERGEDMMVAVNELVINALRADGAAEVSGWTAGDELVWEVADSGPGMHEVTAGYVPPQPGIEGGRGLWLARSLADDATVRPWGPGTAIRLYFRR